MTNRELRRTELLEMLIESERTNEALRKEVENLRQQVRTREIKIHNAGSLADAALQLSSIFEAAQDAADLYLENLRIRRSIHMPVENNAASSEEKVQEKGE